MIQTTFTVAAVLLEHASDAKDRRDPTPHTGQAAARFQDLQKVPLLGLASSSLAEVGLSNMAPPRLTARPCQGMEAFQTLQRLQTAGWRELAFANTGPSQEASR